ncbi:endo-1,3(4)-beta-glucanase [Kwoniella heveanensis CBS 569]|nr:endo-1,3(4)-beta-glucanase [Kwoniella heveanensis CBS 569]
MHLTKVILPALTLSAAAVSAVHLNPLSKRSPAKAQHGVEPAHAKRDGHAAGAHKAKAKRLVKKKKRATCQVKFNATSVATEIPTASVTTSLDNQQNWANATSTATGAATDSVTATASSTTEWASESVSATATSSESTSASAAPSSSSTWQKVEEWSGNSFFDNVNFWEWNDPTHGTVDYLNAGDAWNSGLISINSAGRAVMAVDTTEVVSGGRKSIRIHGNRVFTGGLVIMDAWHMPTGCGSWPAWWQNGPNWPEGGEIDILEGVNDFSQNQVSLHTGQGCTMPSNLNDNQLGDLTTGSYDSYDCSSVNTSNQGCGVRDEVNANAYGAPFNSINGGVYALRWSKAGITAWFFPRTSIPSDITNDAPEPSGWGTPVAHFPSDNCDPYKFFYDHFNIFDTTLCGDWAGADGVWNYAGYAGQDQSCAAITGYSTCSEYVLNKGSAFADAYWEVSYVKYFNSTTEV